MVGASSDKNQWRKWPICGRVFFKSICCSHHTNFRHRQIMVICPVLYSPTKLFHTWISGVRFSLASSNLITQRSHICVNLEVSDSRMDLKCTTVGPFLPLPSDCDCILYDLIIIEGWIIINDLKHHITLNRFLTSVIIVRVKLHSGPRKGSRLTFVVFHTKNPKFTTFYHYHFHSFVSL